MILHCVLKRQVDRTHSHHIFSPAGGNVAAVFTTKCSHASNVTRDAYLSENKDSGDMSQIRIMFPICFI